MTQISLTIRDNLYAKEVEAVAAMNGWTETISDPAFVPTEANPTAPMIPNPVSKEQNFKKWIKAKAANMRIEQANRRALAAVVAEADA